MIPFSEMLPLRIFFGHNLKTSGEVWKQLPKKTQLTNANSLIFIKPKVISHSFSVNLCNFHEFSLKKNLNWV